MQTYIQLEGFVKSNNEAAEAVVKHLTEKYKMEKEEVKKYVDGVTVNPEEIYDSLDKIYTMTKTTKQKQRLVYVHVAEYCIEKLAGRADIVAVSHKETTYWWCTDNAVSAFLRKKRYPEITNGKVSVYLDEFNIQCWKDAAEKVAEHYGNNIIPESNLTGIQYKQKVEKMIDVAYSIMDGAVAPDIFNQIPLKKDGTFQADRTIPVFSNGIGYVDTYIGANSNSYIDACGVQLCIFAEQSEFGHEPADYDQMEFCSKTRAKLVIRERNGLVKKYLLNADMSVNDIVSRAKNLKDTDVKPGSVYAEKSGTEYLYLGRIGYDFKHSKSGHYVYIRYTKKIQPLIDKAKDNGVSSLNDFNVNVLLPDADKFTFSRRDNARKFVKEVKKIFD